MQLNSLNHSMRHFITHNKPANLNGKFVVGSGVGSRNRSVYRALQRRSSNNAQGKPCCISATNIGGGGSVGETPNVLIQFVQLGNETPIVFDSTSGGYYTINNGNKVVYGAGTITYPISTTLTYLAIYDNSITSLDCRGNTYLTTLTLGTLPALTELYCFNCNLTALNVSTYTALTILNCGSNALGANLTLGNLPALTTLYCDNCNLTTLNVSTCTALIVLVCGSNALGANLTLGTLPALTELDCFNCNLTTLNVSTYTALIFLDCGSNALDANLTLGTLPALTTLYCDNCNLTTLNVSTCIALIELVCESNAGLATLTLGTALSNLTYLNYNNCNLSQAQANAIAVQITTINPQVAADGSLVILTQTTTLVDTTPAMVALQNIGWIIT
jgi:hypothetical protein